MAGAAGIEEFAAYLRRLKARTGRSYGSLAGRLHVSTSTLHRYCHGEAVPADYAPVERFARLCEATPEELIRLHRLWLRADAERVSARGNGSGATGRGAAAGPAAGASAGSAGSAGGAARAPADADPGDLAEPYVRGAEAEPAATEPVARAGTRAQAKAAGLDGADPATDAAGATGAAEAAGHADPADATNHAGHADHADADSPNRAAGSAGPESAAGTDAATGPSRSAGRGPGGRPARGCAENGRPQSPPEETGRPEPGRKTARGRRPWPDRTGLRVRRRRTTAAVAGAAAAVVLAVTAVELTGADPVGRPKAGSNAGGQPGVREPGAHPAESTESASSGQPSASAGQSPGAAERSTEPPGGQGASGEPGRGGDRGTAGTADGGRDTGAVPLTLTTRSHVWANGCDHRYLIDRPPSRVPPPPVEQDAAAWAAEQGGVHGGRTNVEVTVQGVAADAVVVLQDLHVRVVGRRAPLGWSSFAMANGCGGSLTPASFDVDLDADRPLAHPTDGFDGEKLPAVRLPYQVSPKDSLVLRVFARTEGCDCQWYLELDWSSGGRKGTVRIDDGGDPFRTSGAEGRPEYGYWADNGGWLRNEG